MNDDMASAHGHPHADRLLDLVLGLLPPGTRRETLAHVAGCPPCEARLREIAAAHERARSQMAAALAATAARPAATIVALAPERHGPVRRRRSLDIRAVTPWLIAACGAVVVGLFVMSRPPLRMASPAPATMAWLPAPDPSVVARGAGVSARDSLVLAGLAAYERRDLAEALRLLESTRADGAMEQVRRVYLANTLLRSGSALPALELLRDLDYAQLPEPWRGESRWALSVALERDGHAAAAESLVRVLATEPGVVGDRARGGAAKREP